MTGLRIKSGLLFVSNFALAKAVAYFSPLWLSYALDFTAYCAIELALSLSPILSTVLQGGVCASLPHLHLVRRAPGLLGVFAFAAAWTSCLALLGVLAAKLFGFSSAVSLVLLATVGAFLQGGGGAFARMHGFVKATSWLENLGVHIMVIMGVVVWASGRAEALPALTISYIALALVTAILGFWVGSWHELSLIRTRLAEALKISAPLLMNSLLLAWIVASSRVMVGTLEDGREKALFFLTFRLAGVFLIAHQAASSFFFVQLYTARHSKFDRIAAGYLAALGTFALILIACAHQLIKFIDWVPAFRDGADVAARFLQLNAGFAFSWIASSVFEARINRYRLGMKGVPKLVLVAAVFSAGCAIARAAGQLTMLGVAMAALLQMTVVATIFWFILFRKRLPLTQAGGVFALFSLLIAIAILTL